MKKITSKEFIEKAKKVHDNKYDYSKVEYVNAKTEVCIICPIHGEFLQKPSKHLLGHGCRDCGKKKISNSVSYTKEEFIEKAKKVHDNKYDYSKVEYKNCDTEVCIICPIHGEFLQKPKIHLQGGNCQKCSANKRVSSQTKKLDSFIREAKKVHGNKYDYSKVEYVNAKTEVCIICPIHGEFKQTPDNHLQGHGCKFCLYDKLKNCRKSNKEEFIKKAKLVHGNKYDYSKVKYVNCDTLVTILCPTHGEFTQTPYNHLHGCSCPNCRNWKLEECVASFLDENKIEYERQKKFDWLGRQSLDIYIPSMKIGIECQGLQHFKPIKYFGGIKGFEKRVKLDKMKKKLCEENKITLLYYSEYKINDEIITSKNDLINILKGTN